MTTDATQLLVRLSPELTTKARGTRKRFTRRLVDNMSDALRTTGRPFEVHDQWNRIFVESEARDADEVLARVPGISSISRVEATCDSRLDEIVRVGRDLFAERVRGRTYAVRARRSGSHDFSSGDVQHQLGAALNPGAKVDLDDPDVEVEVEVRHRTTYFFSGRRRGPGGLPIGVEGRAVCLISGGFDSAVAAYLLLKRGVELDYVFCNIAGEAYERSVVEVAKVLADRWSYGYRPRLHVVDFGPALDSLRATAEPRYWQVVLKRLMYRAADRIAHEWHASGIVTGEAIGQVSSQTLANLRAIDGASEFPVFRPLLGFDKVDIVDLSRVIGTYEISARVKEYCAIAPGHPVTSATPGATAHQESLVEPGLVPRAVEARRVIDLRAVDAADLVRDYLFTDEVPDGAVLLDVRTDAEWDAWHHPAAVHRDPWSLSSELEEMDEDATYVVYCEQGVQAAQIAEMMQKKGFDAFALRGGTRALRGLAASSAEA